MGKAVSHNTQLRDQGFNPVEHRVERNSQLIKCVATAVQVDPMRQAAFAHRFGRRVDIVHTGIDDAHRRKGCKEGEWQGKDQSGSCCVIHNSRKPLVIFKSLSRQQPFPAGKARDEDTNGVGLIRPRPR